MVLTLASVAGVAALGGGIAAGITALVVVAVVALALVCAANALVCLGQMFELLDDND
jgi:hypothetical protein